MMKIRCRNSGLFLTIFVVILTVFVQTEANWFGKRGDKVDDTLFQLLEGNVPGMMDRQLDAQMTLRAISKLIGDYQLRQFEHADNKGGNKR